MVAPQPWISNLREKAQNGKIAFVCGAGVTRSLAAPDSSLSWSQLILSGLDYLEQSDTSLREEALPIRDLLGTTNPSTRALLTAADWIRDCFDERNEGDFRTWLAGSVGAFKLAENASTYLCGRNEPILTSNYDSVLCQLTGRQPYVWTDTGHTERYYSNLSSHIYHLHGHWDEPGSIILSRGDYSRLEASSDVARCFQMLSSGYTFVFIGYGAGLGDPNYTNFMNWYAQNFAATTQFSYVLVRESDLPDKAVTKSNLRYLSYGTQFDDLWSFLDENIPPEKIAEPLVRAITSEAPEQINPLSALPAHTRAEATNQVGPTETLSEFQAEAFRLATELLDGHGVALLAAVTGTGKTTVARIGMNLAIAKGSSAMMLVPTKALVTQEIAAWETWVKAWEADDRQIKAYPVSRDYPESDAPVSRGRFDSCIAIYEKLAGYLAAGHSSLEGTSLLVVDELQTLVEDDDRARKLEGLLTMVRMIPTEKRPAILGLSATLSRRSTETLRAWMGVPEGRFVTAVRRPIPLDTYVLDGRRVRVQRDAHLLALEDDCDNLPSSEEYDHGIVVSPNAMRMGLSGLGNAPIGVALIVKLLKEDSKRRIIAFVPGRTAAEEVAFAIQRGLESEFGPVSRRGKSPWVDGRFADESTSTARARARFEGLDHSDLPLSDHVVRGLRTGVAHHTARLPAQLRRLLEEEFRAPNSVLRVLVATDTLAQGINLPADAVVSFSIATYGRSRVPVLSTPAHLDNKAGRAGRRGLAARERGEFYIVVPTTRDLQEVSNLTAGSVKRLATIGGVFEDFVRGSVRVPRVQGKIRELDQVAFLALQVLCADGYPRSRASLTARIESVVSNLLAANEEGFASPTPEAVRARLDELELIGQADAAKWDTTPLGRALGRSALSLSSAYVLQHLGRLAVAGAGDIDLLFNTFQSPEIEEMSAWVGMPAVPARHKPSIKERLTTYATAYCGDTEDKRRLCVDYFGAVRYPFVDQWVHEGQRVVSVELKELLDRDLEEIDDREATALLRAIVVFEWSRGVPFDELKARISSCIRSDVVEKGKRPVELKIHYSDVEQLAEQVAGVIRCAAAVSYSDKHDWSLPIAALASRVEVGLPGWLAPVARMRLPLLHRNKLARLWDHEPVQEHWSELLTFEELLSSGGISDDERAELKERLDQKEFEEAMYLHRLAQSWASELVPGLAVTFDELGAELDEAQNAGAYVDILVELFDALGLEAGPPEVVDGFHLLQLSAGGFEVQLGIPVGELGAAEVVAMAERDALVLLRTRVRPSATIEMGRGPNRARYVRPEVLLSVFASLVQGRGVALDPGEAVERLSHLRVSVLDAEDVTALQGASIGPPPFDGNAPQIPAGRPDRSPIESHAD